MISSTRSPLLAAILSLLVPGLGQLYNGERAKGVAILCIDAGIGVGIGLSSVGPEGFRSWLSVALLTLVYLGVWIPAGIDAYQYASGRKTSLLSGDNTWYIIFMLLMIGPAAIPLLWQSRRFSRVAKIVWTVIVILIALLGIFFVVVIGPTLERGLGAMSRTLTPFP
jgi:TM2 domain-containing membrane protein YozV